MEGLEGPGSAQKSLIRFVHGAALHLHYPGCLVNKFSLILAHTHITVKKKDNCTKKWGVKQHVLMQRKYTYANWHYIITRDIKYN